MMVMILTMKIIFSVPDSYDNHKIKNIVPIKDINLILKIHKKMCSQAYLEGW